MIQLARQGWLSLDLPQTFIETVTDLFASSTNFFTMAGDQKLVTYPAKAGTEFGYYTVPEEKEYITFRCRIHSNTSSQSDANSSLQKLEDTTAKVWRQAGALLFRILCDLTRWSNLDLSVWDDILDGTLIMPDAESQMTYTLLRLFQYLPTTGVAEKHSDLGLLTMCVGNRSGLEVVDRIASTSEKLAWVCPSTETRTATILIGSTLKALSNGIFNTGVHRVVGNPEGRNSVVFALRHSARHDVDFSLFGGEGRVDPHELWRTLKIGIVNINMVKDKREAQRAELRKSREENDGVPIGHG